MSKESVLLKLIEDLANEPDREYSSKELYGLAIGTTDFIKELYFAQFNAEGVAHNEIYRMMAAIGDELLPLGIDDKDFQLILKTMNSGAKKSRLWISDEAHNLAKVCLSRWGQKIPAITKQQVLFCHVCGKKITEERIKKCFLIDCDNSVCQVHASVLKNPSGTENWFCSQKHYNLAQHDHSYMM